MVYSTKK
ncbi:hypothetical protein [Plasmodium yoelii yoelii]|nr:hypothetical protein [Plasmodium yoelii yoelii]